MGTTTHFAQNKGAPDINLMLAGQAGINSIRDEVYWSDVEQKKGVLKIPASVDRAVNIAVGKGIGVLMILDYGNKFYDSGGMPLSDEAQSAFVRYAEFVARHFKGKIRTYEVWNEWNADFRKKPAAGFGNADSYVRLLAKTYRALKKIDPTVTILAGAVAGMDSQWLAEMMSKGALAYLDGVSIHPYNYDKGASGTPENVIYWLDQTEAVLKRYSAGKEVPIYLTEIGWPTHHGQSGSTPEVSAAYLGRLFLAARSRPYLRGIWWYDFQDDGANPFFHEDNFGLLHFNLAQKPAYQLLQQISSTILGTSYSSRVNSSPDFWVLRFRHGDGTDSLACWSTKPGLNRVTISFDRGTTGEMTIMDTGRGKTEKVKIGDTMRKITLSIFATPWLIRGKMKGVRVLTVPEPNLN